LDKHHLRAFLTKNAPWFEGTIENLNWRMLVKFETHMADAFGKGRIWLTGDSAHMTPPAGILSMNVGMREAFELVDILSRDTNDTQKKTALAAYNATRLAEWEHLLDLNHNICAADKDTNWILRWFFAIFSGSMKTGTLNYL
jgi:2-polyprenyl-6-methoxyphenol hydroxylase-like FAD-dependent oxidoreductase